MSYIYDIENEVTEPKNESFSNFNINDNLYDPLNKIEEEKSDSEDSMITNIIRSQFIKEMSSKNLISDGVDSMENENPKESFDLKNFQNMNSYSNEEKENYDNQKYLINFDNNDTNYQFSFNINSNHSFSSESNENIYITNYGKNNNLENNIIKNKENKIFKIVKISKKEKVDEIFQKEKRHRKKNKKKDNIDWDNIPVPKEKHFHLDRKKKRIVFQRKHLKFIYSISNLEYPINFNLLFNLIKEHVGDKTLANFGSGKSFHILKIKDEFKIVTFKEKRILLNEMKNKK